MAGPGAQREFPAPLGAKQLFDSMAGLNASRIGTARGECWSLDYEPGDEIGEAIQLPWGAEMPEDIESAGLHPDLAPLLECRQEDVTFFDLETLGLGAAPTFLIGFMRFRNAVPVITQLFAEDYSEEGAILEAFSTHLARTAVLVSFNGKSFDMPLLACRCCVWNVEVPRSCNYHHLDLLHEARRRWRSVLPDCRLKTIEQLVCGSYRGGDIPGAEIPDVYRTFVASADARPLAPVFRHNAIDLITMMRILAALLERRAPG